MTRRAGVSLALLLLASAGCKSNEDERVASAAGALTQEPERFEFSLPSDFVPLELRGEGSERLHAPRGARVQMIEGGFRVEAGPEFELEVRAQPPSLDQLAARLEPASIVHRDPETVIFRRGAGHAFVHIRELVPEWDDTERRVLACRSGGVSLGSDATPDDAVRFTRTSVEKMVAACRSLELPKLE